MITILNVVVDAVVYHWKLLVAERSGGGSSNNEVSQPAGRMIRASKDRQWRMEEGHTRLKVKALFFYTDGRMVASIDPGWLNNAFNTLTGIYDQVELRTNVKKTVGMVCHPCRAVRLRPDEAYIRQMTWGGEKIQGATTGEGEMLGVRQGLGERFTGCAQPNPARSGKWGTSEIGKRRRQGRQAHNVQDGVSIEGRENYLAS